MGRIRRVILSKNQVKTLRLQHKSGKENFLEDMRKVFEPVNKSITDVSEDVTKTMPETCKGNKKTLANKSDKFLEKMKKRGILASYVLSPLSKNTNLEITSRYKPVKDPDSNRGYDRLLNKTIPFKLYDNLLTFRDTEETFELEGNFLKTITNKNYKVDPVKLPDKKLMFDFAKEMFFDEKTLSNRSTRDKTLFRLLNHLLSWLLGFAQNFYQKNLKNILID